MQFLILNLMYSNINIYERTGFLNISSVAKVLKD